MKNLTLFTLLLETFICFNCDSQTSQEKLEIYFLDLEGGASTLIVTPLKESVLIDVGSFEPQHRDADRISQACKDAGIEQIDYLITTHFHSDHYGGILELSRRIPIQCFMDKGALPPVHEQNSDRFKRLYERYLEATKEKQKTIRAGDDIPLKNDTQNQIPNIKLHCVAAEKQVEGFDGDIDAEIKGYIIKEPDESDNARSIALVLEYGNFRFFAGGDITWNVEHHLAWPENRVGKIDLYQVTHHGLDMSNNPILLEAIKPKVCVAMNGVLKGIQPNSFKAMKSLASVKDIYQIHFNTQYGSDGNTSPEFIANKQGESGNYIKGIVQPSKNIFKISYSGNKRTKSYKIGSVASVKK